MSTKIQFSAAELAAMSNADFFLTKKNITEKIYALFGEYAGVIAGWLDSKKDVLPDELLIGPPKITKGENYEGLPYIILDHPGIFSTENIFALRTMYHWGNGFSLHLILKGKYKNLLENNVISNLLKNHAGIYTCVLDDPWQHHFRENNYSLYESGKDELAIRNNCFLKLGIQIEANNMNDSIKILPGKIIELLAMIL